MSNPSLKLNWENTFAGLPADFYTAMPPEGFAENPTLLCANANAANLIDLDPKAFQDEPFPKYFAGNLLPEGAEPLAMVYSGHQFGVWAGQLGDGRALMLGQVRNTENQLWEVQLKGGGLTPYSRMGDGRAVLRSCIREYLGSEAMFGLGIPTTRALCIVQTNQPVRRETWEPGAILTRLSPSHVRFGHFEHFYYRKEPNHVKTLADYVIAEHFSPDGVALSYPEWLAEVVKRTAKLMADWQAVGFAHGVMNTDNMSILGLTLDYGPFGFVEAYEPGFICNHSDHSGRYAFANQPAIGLWNLQALAYALQPLIPLEEAKTILASYPEQFEAAYHQQMSEKLGLLNPLELDKALWQKLLALMELKKADYTNTFRALGQISGSQANEAEVFLAQFNYDERVLPWLEAYWQRLQLQTHEEQVSWSQRMRQANPRYVLRNWVAETVIRAAEDEGNPQPLADWLNILHHPYDEHPGFEHFAAPAPPNLQDLCISCSS